MNMYYKIRTLNPVVIDEAIKLIKSGDQLYTCLALTKAASKYHKRDAYSMTPYKHKYSELITGVYGGYGEGAKRPKWWDSQQKHTRSRVNALKRFKKHLEEVALKSKK